jgi:peptidoglycan/xylan/chitin deacetylase (PgdA/CDA1 family)
MHSSFALSYWLAGIFPLAVAYPQHEHNATSLTSGKDSQVVPELRPREVPYGSIITACSVPGNVALTYDDGPGLYTEELLDILDKNKVKATFFILGNAATGPITERKNAKILKRMHARGHHIASHTWSHPDLAFLETEDRREQMERAGQAFSQVLGFAPTYMRPPYVSCPDDCIEDMESFGFHVVSKIGGFPHADMTNYDADNTGLG